MGAAEAPAPALTPAAPSLGRLLLGDLRRGATAGLVGAATVAAFELIASLLLSHARPSVVTTLGFLALDVTLVALGAVVAVPATALAFASARLVLVLVAPERARSWSGFGGSVTPPQPAAAWIVSVVAASAVFVAFTIWRARRLYKRYKEPVWIAALLSANQLGLMAALVLGSLVASRLLQRLAGWLLARPGSSLFARIARIKGFVIGRVDATVTWMVVVATVAGAIVFRYAPQVRTYLPWRQLLAGAAFLAGTLLGARLHAVRGTLVPRTRRGRTVAGAAAALLAFGLMPMTLVSWGAGDRVKYLADNASPVLHGFVRFVLKASDVDGDGFSSLLGGPDCAPWDKARNPLARDIPDNGVDENCNGKDATRRGLPSYRHGEVVPVPAEFSADKRHWNFLLITIDATRYDHTGFGGYSRPTTPNLDKLAARSVVFDFANAPAAGTMASVPAILTSKFFHSGIALSEERRPKPPKVLDENTLIPEVLRPRGYKTAAVLTHEYFNDWGMDQGFDKYDNDLGAKRNERSITSQDVTDKAAAWISDHEDDHWFLWLHYLDPHGRYVEHPGDVQFGGEEMDIYDGEIAYTDKHLGRLLDFLAQSKVGSHTVIIVTSDHGDAFMEHGKINHGWGLYFELLRVPLIVYVPDNEPKRVAGPVSPLDVFPTIADLAGVDVSELDLEGESLVPQLFYDKDATDRVVFAETNLGTEPEYVRAAITNDYKLIVNVNTNTRELYDLHKDPREQQNLWGRDAEASAKMKSILDEWLDRHLFVRDPVFNQAEKVRRKNVLPGPPRPQHAAAVTAGGAVEVVGWDGPARASPGASAGFTLYFKSAAKTALSYQVELSLVAEGTAPVRVAKYPKNRTFPTSAWEPGEYVKDQLSLRVPPGVTAAKATLQVRFLDDAGKPAPMTGEGADGDHATIGEIELMVPPSPPPVPSTRDAGPPQEPPQSPGPPQQPHELPPAQPREGLKNRMQDRLSP